MNAQPTYPQQVMTLPSQPVACSLSAGTYAGTCRAWSCAAWRNQAGRQAAYGFDTVEGCCVLGESWRIGR